MKQKLLYGVIAVLLIGYGTYIVTRVSENRAFVSNTETHLENEGYDLENDIIEMYRVNIGEDSPQNAMVVRFVDEPRINHFYTYKPDSEELILLDTRFHQGE